MPEPCRQFRVLYRDFLLRLVDMELISPGGDPRNLITNFGALLAAFSFVQVLTLLPKYSFFGLPPEVVAQAAWGDQEFLISTTMAVVGLFAVIAWDGVFLTRQDSLALGPLPLRTGTIFRAKIAAVATGLALSIVAVNVAIGLSYPAVAGAHHLGSLGVIRAFAAYWIVMAAAGAFVFCTFLAMQGLASAFLTYPWFLRVSSFLQLLAFFVVLGGYFLSPGSSDLDLSNASHQRWIARLPQFWFVGLFQRMIGAAQPTFGEHAARALWAISISASVAAATYTLSYLRNVRRVIEQPDLVPSNRINAGAKLTAVLAQRLLRAPLERAILLFSLRTLARSRQHRVVLAFFAGIGIAIALTYAKNLLYGYSGRWNDPNIATRAGGFVLLFFAVIGARAVFALPASLKSNWIFRITAVHSPRAYFSSVRKSLYWLAAAPVWAALCALYFALWPRLNALAHAMVLGAVGVILVERALSGFQKIPFACSYLPGKSNLKLRFGAYGIGFLFVIYTGASIEAAMLSTVPRTVVLGGVLLFLVAQARRKWMQFAGTPLQQLQFEDKEPAVVSPLDLHDASAYAREYRYVDAVNSPPEPSLGSRVKAKARRVALATLALAAVGATYERINVSLHPAPPLVGTLVDIGGRRLNIHCLGEGSPAVVFESGRGGAGIEWSPIQQQIAPLTRTCWYDRAGYGWSDSGPFFHPSSAIADDLHHLLERFGVPPPYLLVGMSFGGLNVRVYRKRYPRDVAGMVLVDSTHVDEGQPITPFGGGYLPYFPMFAPVLAQVLRHTGVVRMLFDLPPSPFEPRTLAESEKEMDYESLLQARAAGPMGDLPLTVLTAGKHNLRPPEDLFEARRFRAFERHWIESQRQLALLSSRGVQVVLPESGHVIQRDRPDAVIDAIRDVLHQARGSQ